MEHSVEWELAGETEIFGENLFCPPLIQTWTEIGPGQPWYEVGETAWVGENVVTPSMYDNHDFRDVMPCSLVDLHTTRHYIPEDRNVHIRRHENLISHSISFLLIEWETKTHRLEICEVIVLCGLVKQSRSQRPRGLRHELSSLARMLGSWVRIPLKAWMSVCVYSVFVLSCV
jgi:hypothetical protein